PVHGRGVRGGDDRVPGVVVGRGRGDAQAARRRPDRTRERDRLLDVEALGDEDAAEPEGLRRRHLVEQLGGRPRRPRQRVEPELVELLHAPPLVDADPGAGLEPPILRPHATSRPGRRRRRRGRRASAGSAVAGDARPAPVRGCAACTWASPADAVSPPSAPWCASRCLARTAWPAAAPTSAPIRSAVPGYRGAGSGPAIAQANAHPATRWWAWAAACTAPSDPAAM